MTRDEGLRSGPLWDEVEALFFRALEMDRSERVAWVQAEAAEPALASEVLAMLEAHDQPGLEIEWLLGEADRSRLPPDAASPTLAGHRIGAYRVLDTLGRGGMGEVYLAERDDERFERRVAIKLMGSSVGQNPVDLVPRFELERHVLAQLQHPGIAQLLDAGSLDDGRPYLVMEYVPGEPITDYCDRHRLDLAARLRLFQSVCEVVQFAHARLVIHRDLKPSNILVMDDASADGPFRRDRVQAEVQAGTPSRAVVKLLDFGIAKLVAPERIGLAGLETQTSARPMTPLFAAPEQFAGEALTTATDVYALGILFYLLLTGAPPFVAKGSAADFERRVRSGTPRRLPDCLSGERDGLERAALRGMSFELLQKQLGGDLDRIAAKALHQDPERRYVSAGQLGEEIGRYLSGEAILAQDDTRAYRLRVFVRRHKGPVLAALAVGLCLLVLSTVLAIQTFRTQSALELATAESERRAEVVSILMGLFATADPSAGPVGDHIPVQDFLARANRAVESLDDDPELQTQLLFTLGQIRQGRGEGQAALSLLQAAAQTHRALPQPDDATALAETSRAREQLRLDHELAKALAMVDNARGLERLRRSHEDHVAVYGADSVQAANASLDLAAHLDPLVGLPIMDQAIARLEADLGPQDLHVARALGKRAPHRGWVGQLEGATQDAERALRLLEETLGADHSETLRALHTYSRMKPRHESVPLLYDLIERQERVFGQDSAPIANSLNTLGEHLARMGEVEAAAEAFRRAVEIRTKHFGPRSPTLANPQRNLAVLTGLLGRYEAASRLFEELQGAQAAEERSRTYIEIQSTFVAGRAGGPASLAKAIERIERLVATLDRIRVGTQDRYPCQARLMLAKLLLADEQSRRAVEVSQAAHDEAASLLAREDPVAVEAAFLLARARYAAGLVTDDAELQQRLAAYAALPLHEVLEVEIASAQLAASRQQATPQ